MQPENAEILSEPRAAEFLGKQPRTLANWRAFRQGPPFIKIGRTVAYRRAALLAWLEGQERPCGGDTSAFSHTASSSSGGASKSRKLRAGRRSKAA